MSKQKLSDGNYKPTEIEPYWQKVWEQNRIYSPNLYAVKSPFYNLMMFPYPSAEGMHVGNMYAFTGADVFGRFMRMKGYHVFEPIGLDGFGIHSENFAIKVGHHPKEQAKISEKNFYRQLRATGNGFDWSRKLETYDPKYYKWTQWLFIQLFKAGLAYRGKAKVNWCPSCKTVLADEQVITKLKVSKNVILNSFQDPVSSGKEIPKSIRQAQDPEFTEGQVRNDNKEIAVCERCETEVTKKDLEQWFFRITKYADRLLVNIEKLDWSEKVKIAQRQWIGRSEGAKIKFKVQSSRQRPASQRGERGSPKAAKFKVEDIDVFTTRPDTLYGATFLVISPEHPLVDKILSQDQNDIREKVRRYVDEAKKKTEQERMADPSTGSGQVEKTGVFSGLYGVNPVNNENIPVWIADYALMDYGTGALFGDAHDQRDVKFANKYGIPLKPTIITKDKEKDKKIMSLQEVYTGYGILVDSGEFSGLTSQEAKKKITAWLKKHNAGGPHVTYHLRDWLISRQRYWGPPIPMIYCDKCGWQPVPEKDLPVLLPDVKDWKPLGTGKSPLANHPEFYNVKCPNCKGPAKRETDVSDTFLDSAWYFFRYTSTDIESGAFDTERVKKWLPVKMYIGGAEHSVLHLLYSRFITMVLHDLGYIDFEEPFSRFFAHGLLIKEGAKMSKSKGNVVVPDEYIRKFGADTLRMYLMFLGPFSQGGDFYDTGIEGMHRFVRRVWRLVAEHTQNPSTSSGRAQNDAEKNISVVPRLVQQSFARLQFMHKTIKKVTGDIEHLRYNTAIAAMMEWYNFMNSELRNPASQRGEQNSELTKDEAETFLKLLAPFAPHMSEELWQRLRHSQIHAELYAEIRRNSVVQRSVPLSSAISSIHLQPWPKFDPKYLEEDEVTIVVQVNGRVRDTIKYQKSILRQSSGQDIKNQKEVEDRVKEIERVRRHLDGKQIRKVVYVEGKVINFVTD